MVCLLFDLFFISFFSVLLCLCVWKFVKCYLDRTNATQLETIENKTKIRLSNKLDLFITGARGWCIFLYISFFEWSRCIWSGFMVFQMVINGFAWIKCVNHSRFPICFSVHQSVERKMRLHWKKLQTYLAKLGCFIVSWLFAKGQGFGMIGSCKKGFSYETLSKLGIMRVIIIQLWLLGWELKKLFVRGWLRSIFHWLITHFT